MPRTCTVCRSGEVEAIDEAIVSGVPQRRIAETYRASRSAVYRHASGHLPDAVRAAAARREDTRYERVVARLAALADEGDQVLQTAKESGSDHRLVLAAIREQRETLGVLAKASQPNVSDQEVQALVQALGRTLPRFPDAAEALAEELDHLGATDAAQVIAMAARS